MLIDEKLVEPFACDEVGFCPLVFLTKLPMFYFKIFPLPAPSIPRLREEMLKGSQGEEKEENMSHTMIFTMQLLVSSATVHSTSPLLTTLQRSHLLFSFLPTAHHRIFFSLWLELSWSGKPEEK